LETNEKRCLVVSWVSAARTAPFVDGITLMTDLGTLEDTADHLQDAVNKAIKRVVLVATVYAFFGVLLFLVIVVLRNITPGNIAAIGSTHTGHLALHYVLRDKAIDTADLFVLSTAMLAVIAAINIGVAVMPQQDAVAGLDAATLRSRARAIVWNRSLGIAAYFCALTAMIAAAVGWMSGRLPAVWPSAATLTVIALIAVLVAANVGSLADDEAERLMDWHSQRNRVKRIDRGVTGVLRSWRTVRKDLRRRGWVGWVLLVIAALYALDLLVELAMTVMYSTTPGLVFSQWLGWRALLLYGVVYTLLGSYFVVGIGFLNRWHFCASIRSPRAPDAGGVARWGHVGRIVAIGVADAGLVTILLVAGLRSHEVRATLLLAVIWVMLPQALCSWAQRRGRGLFRIIFERALLVCIDERDRLEAQVEKSEREFAHRVPGRLNGRRTAEPGDEALSDILWRG
jgi:hypothetical protein